MAKPLHSGGFCFVERFSRESREGVRAPVGAPVRHHSCNDSKVKAIDVDQLMRLKGTLEASEGIDVRQSGKGLVASYPRIRTEVINAIDDAHEAEFERLFPSELSTEGQPWGKQAGEVKLYIAQMAGWISGIIESGLLDRRIRAEAEAKAKRVGFE